MSSDGRDPAHTCACCGQLRRATGSLTLHVEDAVLNACNQSFAAAEAHSHTHVDVAHLITVLAQIPAAIVVFWQHNLDPAVIADAAGRRLAQMQRRNRNEPVTASGELRTLLISAEARAGRDGRTHASLTDLVGLIVELSAQGMDRLRHGRRVAGVCTSTAHCAGATGMRPRSDGAASYDALNAAGTQSNRPLPESEQIIIAQLVSRLDRLEAEVAMWRAGANKGASNRSGPGQAESATVATRGPAFLPGYHSVSTQSTTDRVYLRRCLRQRKDQTRRRRDRMLAAADRARHDSSGMGRPWSQRNSGSGSPNRSSRTADLDHDDGAAANDTAKRFYLALDDVIERAPSIGPKTTGRLVAAGVTTVRDLLAADPDDLATRVRAKFITPQRLRDWQAQARLVCTVPFLRGTHAQLLVGAGYPALDVILDADPSLLCAAILKFATTRDGQSVLRTAPPPDMERIQRWLENAAIAEPARAAA